MSNKIILKYIGTGSFLEVPARDLSEDDLNSIKWTGWDADKLAATGHYEFVEKKQSEEKTTRKVKHG